MDAQSHLVKNLSRVLNSGNIFLLRRNVWYPRRSIFWLSFRLYFLPHFLLSYTVLEAYRRRNVFFTIFLDNCLVLESVVSFWISCLVALKLLASLNETNLLKQVADFVLYVVLKVFGLNLIGCFGTLIVLKQGVRFISCLVFLRCRFCTLWKHLWTECLVQYSLICLFNLFRINLREQHLENLCFLQFLISLSRTKDLCASINISLTLDLSGITRSISRLTLILHLNKACNLAEFGRPKSVNFILCRFEKFWLSPLSLRAFNFFNGPLFFEVLNLVNDDCLFCFLALSLLQRPWLISEVFNTDLVCLKASQFGWG